MAQDQFPNGLPFAKMHGLGNDFVVIDARETAVAMTTALARALGDRNRGVGFDQLAVIEPGKDSDIALRFWNADGSSAAACGNATRCIAWAEMARSGRRELIIRTDHGLLQAVVDRDGDVSVNMGRPGLDWTEIPLSEPVDTLNLPIDGNPVATSMGNPHMTFFVDDADAVDLTTLGRELERHPLYPQRTNVQFAHVVGPEHLRMRVWERGAGITLASGSSSCAVVVAAARRGLTGRKVRLTLDGGDIKIDWRDDGVWMTGPSAHVFDGVLTPAFLAAL
ncbi:MAG: diaminopimelate epimerase [Pseudomonadota bacterium]